MPNLNELTAVAVAPLANEGHTQKEIAQMLLVHQ
jgi:hypothetical protein